MICLQFSCFICCASLIKMQEQRRSHPTIKTVGFPALCHKLRQFLFPYELKKTFNLMKKNPESLNIFGSKTWKWWASYLNYDLTSDLLKIDNPIYMIHGELDEFVPILSANLIKSAFKTANKKNFTLLSYSDLGHSMVGRDDIFQDLMDLINENLKKD